MSNFENYNNTNLYENQNLNFKANRYQNKNSFFFVISIVLFVLGFLLSCLKAFVNFKYKSYYANAPYASGYAVGNIVISLIIITTLFFLSTRVFKKKAILLIFSIIYLIFSFSSTIFVIQACLKEAKMNKASKEKFIIMCNNVANERQINEENFDKSVYGSTTPFLSLSNDYFIKFQKLSNDTSKDIDSLELDKILTVKSLGNTEKINNSKKKINDCIKIFDKHESEYNDLIDNFASSASTLELPKPFKDGLLEGFTKSQIENRTKINNFFKVERDILDNINNIMDFMLSIQGKYIIQNDKILFETENDLNKYNEYVDNLNKLAQKETDIKKDMYDSLKVKLNNLNKL